MTITGTPIEKTGGSVLIYFTDESGADLLPGGRYVSSDRWDDPDQQERIIVALYEEIKARTPPAVSEPVHASAKSMKESEIQTKQAAIVAEKEELAREQANDQIPAIKPGR